MFEYYIKISFRNLRKNFILTLLMVIAIGFGVSASMTTYAVYRAMSGDAIPWKSSKLFMPRIDVWGPESRQSGDEPANALTYMDAIGISQGHRAKYQSLIYSVSPVMFFEGSQARPESVNGQAVQRDFFPMLDIPFQYGSPWSLNDEGMRADVAVINSALNDRVFHGQNSVGRHIRLDGRLYQIRGVLNDWHPHPKYYSSGDVFAAEDEIFLPFETAIANQIDSSGDIGCGNKLPDPGFAGMLTTSCVWIGALVELDTQQEVAQYKSFLDNYTDQQRAAGRFSWKSNNRLRDLPDWLESQQVVPRENSISVVVAFCLLAACMVSTIGLLLAKFLQRSHEIGIRRALGAPRLSIACQFMVEASTIGLIGGVVAIYLTVLGVKVLHSILPENVANLTHIDTELVLQTIFLAIIATVLAGFYPIWRAAYVRPSLQLKED
jgi:putative ABC transport system permease protein